MSSTDQQSPAQPNRRASVRKLLRSSIQVECRKGAMGFGPSLTRSFSDVSQTGVRLLLKSSLNKGDEAEVVIIGGGSQSIKRLAEVVWAVPKDKGACEVGLRFRQPLTFSEVQQLAKPG